MTTIKNLNVEVPEELIWQCKMTAGKLKLTLKDLVKIALEEYVEKNGRDLDASGDISTHEAGNPAKAVTKFNERPER